MAFLISLYVLFIVKIRYVPTNKRTNNIPNVDPDNKINIVEKNNSNFDTLPLFEIKFKQIIKTSIRTPIDGSPDKN